MSKSETSSGKIFYMEEDILIKYFEYYKDDYFVEDTKKESPLNIGFIINFITNFDYNPYKDFTDIYPSLFSEFSNKNIRLICIPTDKNYGIFEIFYFHKNPELDLFNTLIEKAEDAKKFVTDYINFIKEK